MRFSNDVFTFADTASHNFPAIDTNQVLALSVQASFSENTAAGTVKLQASNDFSTAGNLAGTFVPTNWVDIAGATVTVVAGATVLIPKTEVSYNYVRVVFTQTGGAGTMTVNVCSMGY